MKRINIAMMEQVVIEQYPQELDELIADTFYKMVNGVDVKAAVYILHTIGTILENYASYRGRDKAPGTFDPFSSGHKGIVEAVRKSAD